MKKWLLRGLGAVLILILTGAGGGWIWLRSSLPQLEGTIRLTGPSAEIEVLRDKDGVPHIFAETDRDAYFALGFVHAQDRLFHMEMTRRIPAGRLSELVGEHGLRVDRFMRTLGIAPRAEQSLATLSADVRGAIEAYSAGVNAWLAHRSGALPPEFVMLRHEPEPWRPVDSIMWGAFMSLQLSGNWRQELLRARLAETLDADTLAMLFPPYPPDAPVTAESRRALFRTLPLDRLEAQLPAEAKHSTASNQWVVAGARSASGKPMLANDTHLGFSAPIIWHLVRIETPELAVTGATIPGVPFVVLGHNRRIAWGLSTTNGDQQDVYIERLDPDDPTRYVTPDGPMPFRRRTEIIRVRGGDDVALTVRETRHGPVLSDLIPDADAVAGQGHVLSLAASFLNGENRTAEAVYRLNRARNWASFTAALRHWQGPQQNILYADVDGNVGFIAPSRVPVRRSGDGFMPAPGWTGSHDWIGFVPFDELPRVFNPARGVIVNANNRITPPGYPHFISREWDAPFRAQRIEDLLSEAAKHSPQDFAAMQADTLSLAARALVPLLLRADPTEARARQAMDMLVAWDGRMDKTAAAPLIFVAWTLELSRALFAPLTGERLSSYLRLRPLVLTRMLDDGGRWCDDETTAQTTEACKDRLGATLARALARLTETFGDDMTRWRWGEAHRAEFRNRVFEHVPVYGSYTTVAVETDGGDYTVNRGTPILSEENDPFRHVHGAVFRGIYDLADLSRSRFMQPVGQSGNPLSPHYDDLNRRWANFDYLVLGIARKELLSGGARRLVLAPASATENTP